MPAPASAAPAGGLAGGRAAPGDGAAPGSGGGGRWALAAGATAVAATGLALAAWSRWRQPKASKEDVVQALQTLTAECAGVYAQVADSVARAGPPPTAADAAGARAKLLAAGVPLPEEEEDTGDGGQEEDSAAKLRQVIEQPLVLTEALQEVAARSAARLVPGAPADAEALERVLEDFQGEPQVQAATAELRGMHEVCLEGRGDPCAEGSAVRRLVDAWQAAEALDMLRELTRAKGEALKGALREAPGGGAARPGLGADVLRACAAAEDLVWERRWPGDEARRSVFGLALSRLGAEDRQFRERRAAVEREAEAFVTAPAAAATHRVLAAF